MVVKCLHAGSSAYHTALTSSLHKHLAVPIAGFLWIMVEHRHTLPSTSEVIKASMLATFERGPTANILHTSPRYLQQKHTEACRAHATHKIGHYFMESCRKISCLEDKHTVSIPSDLNHNSCLLIPPYLQSIFAFLCSLKVAGRHFSILTLF